MKSLSLKTVLLIVFTVLLLVLTYLGLNKSTADIDFAALQKSQNDTYAEQSRSEFETLIKNIGNSTQLVKPDILQSDDTARLSLSIRLLDTMRQFIYAGILTEKLAHIQPNANHYHRAARYFLMATGEHKHELDLFRRARINLDKCLEKDPSNLDAKVDLAVSIYNINNMHAPENQTDLMKPALLLREVIQSDSNHLEGLYYLGKLAVETNQTEKAIARFKKLISLQPQNPEYYLELSSIYRMRGEEKEAQFWEEKSRMLH